MDKPKLIRITTVPQSLRGLLKGQLKFMSDHFEVIGISSPGEALADVERNEGVRVVPITMTRTISPIHDLKAFWKLYRFLKKEKPLIVHTHTPKAGIVGMAAAKMAAVPFRLHTVAGMPLLIAKGKKRKLLDMVERYTYSLATKVYPNSYGLYDIILANRFTSKDKLKVIGNGSSNGIDTSFFDPAHVTQEQTRELKERLGIKPHDFVYIFVGRVVKDKGINELVAAFKKLNAEFPDTKLILVGTFERELNPLFPETETEINRNESIIPVGYQSDVRLYFSIGDVLTFPSYREGFPNVVMQACAMELNSIVTDINGCNEIVSDGVNGFIIPVKDSESLFEKMKYLYLNQDENKTMSKRGRTKMCESFERQYVWGQILSEYEQLTKIKMPS